MSVALLELDAVSAGYRGHAVLHQLSLRVEAGQSWAVLGPNGAGKSTLVRVVMGQLVPSAGTVRVEGVEVGALGAARLSKSVAWVPQVTDDATEFTGLELALMGRAPHDSSWAGPSGRDVERARAMLKALGVEALADRPLREVSGGERRRVWLARALVQEPKVLVLDEPTAFLDVKHQLESLHLVQAKVKEGLGVVAVLHDVNLAQRFSTHAVLLKAGRVLASGRCDEVLTAPLLSELYDVPMGMQSLWSPS